MSFVPSSSDPNRSSLSLAEKKVAIQNLLKEFDDKYLQYDEKTKQHYYPDYAKGYVSEIMEALKTIQKQQDEQKLQQEQERIELQQKAKQLLSHSSSSTSLTSPTLHHSLSPSRSSPSLSSSSTNIRYSFDLNNPNQTFLREHGIRRSHPHLNPTNQKRLLAQNSLKNEKNKENKNPKKKVIFAPTHRLRDSKSHITMLKEMYEATMNKQQKIHNNKNVKKLNDNENDDSKKQLKILSPKHSSSSPSLSLPISLPNNDEVVSHLSSIASNIDKLTHSIHSKSEKNREKRENNERKLQLLTLGKLKELEENQTKQQWKLKEIQENIRRNNDDEYMKNEKHTPRPKSSSSSSQHVITAENLPLLQELLLSKNKLEEQIQSLTLEYEKKNIEFSLTQRELNELKQSYALLSNEKNDISSNLSSHIHDKEKVRYNMIQQISDLMNLSNDLKQKREKDRHTIDIYENERMKIKKEYDDLYRKLMLYEQQITQEKQEKDRLEKKIRDFERNMIDQEMNENRRMRKDNFIKLPGERLRTLVYKALHAKYKNKLEIMNIERNSNHLPISEVQQQIENLKKKHEHELNHHSSTHNLEKQVLIDEIDQHSALTEDLSKKYMELNEKTRELEMQVLQKDLELMNSEKENAVLQTKIIPPNVDHEKEEFANFMLNSFKGDYLNYRSSSRVLSMVYSYKDNDILFSDYVHRFDGNNKLQKRILLLTDSALYTLKTDALTSLKRRIGYEHILCISMSRKSTDVFVVHVDDHYDYMFSAPKRAEFMYILMKMYQAKLNKPLEYKFAETLYVGGRDAIHHRNVDVPASQSMSLSMSNIVRP